MKNHNAMTAETTTWVDYVLLAGPLIAFCVLGGCLRGGDPDAEVRQLAETGAAYTQSLRAGGAFDDQTLPEIGR